MTKVEALKKLMADNGGTATWEIIYDNIANYYPAAMSSKKWKEALRGTLYREINSNQSFKKIGLGIFALIGYEEEKIPVKSDKVRMHSYIEGICLELGNLNKYSTYTADPSAIFKDNIRLENLAGVEEFPLFTYPEIISEAKRIDVVWFNAKGLQFPQRVFEVVDSVGTLQGALNRSSQLLHIKTEFYIVAPLKHKDKYNKTIKMQPYYGHKERFKFIEYDQLIELYENTKKAKQMEKNIFL